MYILITTQSDMDVAKKREILGSPVGPVVGNNWVALPFCRSHLATGRLLSCSTAYITVSDVIYSKLNSQKNGKNPISNCDLGIILLTHRGRMTHKCVSKLTIIGSDNGLLPGRCQATIWTNAGIWSIGTFGTNFSEILIEIQTFSLNEMHLKSLSQAQCVNSVGRYLSSVKYCSIQSWPLDGLYFNSLGPSDAIWRQRSGTTLAQVMACCLAAPCHYLNQYWLIISEVQWHSY